MIDDPRVRLAVLGSPISHSLSPALHEAAYRELALDWSYRAIDMTGDALADFVASCEDDWRGLSLTMPLKRDVMPLLDSVDDVAALTGAANTLLFDNGVRRGFNTDVFGITRSFTDHDVDRLRDVVILGGGATAASAMVAAAQLGAERVAIWVRSPAKATPLTELGRKLGIAVSVRALTEVGRMIDEPDAVISTLPNGSVVDLVYPESVRRSAVLFDVAYEPWPTPLAHSWLEVSGRVVPGIDMLVNQAVAQVRVFVAGDPLVELPGEEAVITAMRSSIDDRHEP